jgi:hypothetical protein
VRGEFLAKYSQDSPDLESSAVRLVGNAQDTKIFLTAVEAVAKALEGDTHVVHCPAAIRWPGITNHFARTFTPGEFITGRFSG